MTDIVKQLRAPCSPNDEFIIGQWPGEEPVRYDVLRSRASDEIERLRARLEIDPSHPYDGIYARDETIRQQDKQIDRLRAENEWLRAENFSLAAWQCEFTDGKTGLVAHEHGGTYCAMAKENERLRNALHYYADFHENSNDGPWGMQSDDFGSVARAALEGM